MLQQAVTQILQSSDEPPIIIIQSDHGSRVFLNGDSAEKTCARERMSILNALYLPDNGASQFYESITPVNTFRVIFNTYFNTNFDLLEDRSYLAANDQPYDFLDVTDKNDVLCTDSLTTPSE
jgi:hypothetical protein